MVLLSKINHAHIFGHSFSEQLNNNVACNQILATELSSENRYASWLQFYFLVILTDAHNSEITHTWVRLGGNILGIKWST